MGDEMERAKEIDDAVKAADAKRRADAEASANAGEKLDKILECLDSLSTRMDAYESKDKDKDEEKEEEDKPKPLGADSVRKDSADAADVEEIATYKRENGATRAIAADSVIAQIQSDADRAATAWGKSAAHPWTGEKIVAYRRRVAREHQQHSKLWKDVDLRTLEGQSLRNACTQIFTDSIAASSSPESYGETLREVRRRDPISGARRSQRQFAEKEPRPAELELLSLMS